jgi:hypothetical protein
MNKEKIMINVPSKLMLAAIFASLTIVGSVSYAAPGKSKGAGGWEPSADHLESVVISLHTDPLVDPEPACVALQIGMNLLMDTVPVGQDNVSVTPADEVILFTTTGGVELINPENQDAFNEPDCDTPAGPESRSLNQLLGGFVDQGGEVVVCPLCATNRGITDPTIGDMGNGEVIHNLFLYGDKVIDF